MGKTYKDKTKNSSFYEKLKLAEERNLDNFNSIRKHLAGVGLKIRVADKALDKKGADYVVTSRSMREIYIDAKNRLSPVIHNWKIDENGNLLAEICIETAAMMYDPDNDIDEKKSWLLDENKITDYYLFTYLDYPETIFIDTEQLRLAYMIHWEEWHERFDRAYQSTENFTKGKKNIRSACIFVPLDIVLKAMGFNDDIKYTIVSDNERISDYISWHIG